MGDVGAGGLCGQGCGTGVGEEIEHPRRLGDAPFYIVGTQTGHLPVDEIPVRSLFRKDAHVLEGRKAQAQVQVRTAALREDFRS